MLTRRNFLARCGFSLASLALPPVRAFTAEDDARKWVELHRIRISNRKDGAIQISTDGGKSWLLIGRVVAPATTVVEGFLAAAYAEPGTVAATAVHGLRIRTGGAHPGMRAPFLLSISPKEYGGPVNKGFGGFPPQMSAIVTDIPAGTAIFRDLAPFVGNPVHMQGESGRLLPFPDNFKPTGAGAGETLVIVVRRPQKTASALTFENKKGGQVRVTWADDTTEKLTEVLQPVQGVGRFDGTIYTGVGRINTAHTGTITVGTAPLDPTGEEGRGTERRGGFQIHPAWHNARTEEAGAAVILIVGEPGTPRRKDWEGRAPLFRDAVSLADDVVTEVQIDDGDWEPMPAIVGSQPDAFTGPGLTRIWKSQKINRTAKSGVTAFRIRLPKRTGEHSETIAATVSRQYQAGRLSAAQGGQIPLVQGTLTINAAPTDVSRVALVRLFVEGEMRGITNHAPFTLDWNTTRQTDGEYLVTAEAVAGNGDILARTHRRVFVQNKSRAVVPTNPVGG